jgi:toxin ParE1/3/4
MIQAVFRPEAEIDLAAIALHVAQSSPERARALVARLRHRTLTLITLPRAGRPRPEFGADLRSLVERPYVLFYRVIGDTAEIVAIVHGARDLPKALAARIARDAEP